MSRFSKPKRSIAGIVQAFSSRQPRRGLAIGAVLAVAALSASETGLAQMNQPPMAMNDYAMTMEDQPTVIKILSNDYDMSAALAPSSVTIVSHPLYGGIVVSPTTGNVLYIPDPDFYGSDCFEYTVSDVNGRVSNVASVMISVAENVSPPVITSFIATNVGGNQWTFSGTVSDAELAGNVVTFGGLISGTATTNSRGSFNYGVTLPAGSSGNVTAQATNDEGISSTIAYDYVVD
jgi:hypothetical protein